VPSDSKQFAGEIAEDGIRYVLMRPDVLMGVAHELDASSAQAFLRALERSAFRHVQMSFTRYQAREPLSGTDFIANTCEAAARLGWGVWSAIHERDSSLIVEVRNSPFAAGFGVSDKPVCSAIVGILRAVALTAYGLDCQVTELACAAQGAPACRFEIRSPVGAEIVY
jgi:uncharacterized protein